MRLYSAALCFGLAALDCTACAQGGTDTPAGASRSDATAAQPGSPSATGSSATDNGLAGAASGTDAATNSATASAGDSATVGGGAPTSDTGQGTAASTTTTATSDLGATPSEGDQVDPPGPSSAPASSGGPSPAGNPVDDPAVTSSSTDVSPPPASTTTPPATASSATDDTSTATVPAAETHRFATFNNGGFWNDISGSRIEAHGGGFIQVEDTWYWIGEDKSHNSGKFKAVNCYASQDLEHWEFHNAIITPSTTPELGDPERIIERPKVLYNGATGKFVMWLHWEGKDYAPAEAGVFSSDTVCGDYTFEAHFRPRNNMSRDDNLFKDSDGKAYFVSAANENADMIIYELTADYLDIQRQVVTLWVGSYREAPALFKNGDTYYLVTSGATGWDPNQAKYATAPSMDGPWSSLQNLGNDTTYDTQSTYVLPFYGSQVTTYIYAGDRWQDPDLQSSKYIWLPLKVNGNNVSLDYYDEWQLDLDTGTWRVDDGYVPQSGWKLLFVDSEELTQANNPGTNAFDDSPSTFWHTSWDTTVTLPHEIQIDMGEEILATGMRYTPRQDKDANGTIVDYEFYLSDDRAAWGDPVSSGRFPSERVAHDVTFAAKQGRYIRLVALSEVNGDGFTSVAELDVLGTPL